MLRSDEDLVHAFQAGEAAAFDALVSRWDRRIQGVIYRVVGADEDARDVCQEVFLKAYRGLPTFKKEARFSSWLYQIALNACRDRLRRRRGRMHMSLSDLEETADAPFGAPAPSALERVASREVKERMGAAMATLPEEQREVIVLKEYEGLTFPEIAELLAVPVSTVKTRLYRGLVQLRQRLEEQDVRRTAPVPLPHDAGVTR
jgi:RNA polymerase sigma-70 factor (ECF subfamily)